MPFVTPGVPFVTSISGVAFSGESRRAGTTERGSSTAIRRELPDTTAPGVERSRTALFIHDHKLV
jgi:hypothetical protein